MYYTDREVNRGSVSYADSFSGYLSRVFLMMFLGLGVTGLVAVFGSYSEAVVVTMLRLSSGNGIFVFFLLYIGIVFGFQHSVSRLNTGMALVLFFAYAAITGFMWSILGLAFEVSAIWKAFLAAGIFFGVMALYGATTKRDLGQFRTILFVGLISILIVSMLNFFFFRSSGLDMGISILGILIFAGYTAYDVRMLRGAYESVGDERSLNAIAIYGAFQLYLDFINLFLYLLRLFGRRRD